MWVLAFLLVYGYELFNFSLSIDEELHTFDQATLAQAWLQQGRWGMSLLVAALPPISAVPVASTALFGVGLLLTIARLVSYYRLRGLSAHVFALVLIASPIWPHLVEFNSLSYGIGIGFALCAIGVDRLLRERVPDTTLGIVALAIAAGIYQTILLAAIVMVLGRYVLDGTAWRGIRSLTKVARELGLVALGGVLSSCVQYGAMLAAHVSLRYVDIYWRLPDYAHQPLVALAGFAKASGEMLLGTSPLYLGGGSVLAIAPLVAFVYSLVRPTRAVAVFVRVLFVAVSLLVCLVPVFVSAGSIPARAMIALPVLVAIMAACVPVEKVLERRLVGAYLGLAILWAVTISSRLFYSDHVMRDRDLILATSLARRLEQIRPAAGPLRIAVFGAHRSPGPPVESIQVFGASFFEQDGGNPWRIASYLKILGVGDLVGAPLSPELAIKASSLPSWPNPGAVALVDGIAVIKLGPISYAQKLRLCTQFPGCPLCH